MCDPLSAGPAADGASVTAQREAELSLLEAAAGHAPPAVLALWGRHPSCEVPSSPSSSSASDEDDDDDGAEAAALPDAVARELRAAALRSVQPTRKKLLRRMHQDYVRGKLAGVYPEGMRGLSASQPWLCYWALQAGDLLGALGGDGVPGPAAFRRFLLSCLAEETPADVAAARRCLRLAGAEEEEEGHAEATPDAQPVRMVGFAGAPAGQCPHAASSYAAVAALAITGNIDNSERRRLRRDGAATAGASSGGAAAAAQMDWTEVARQAAASAGGGGDAPDALLSDLLAKVSEAEGDAYTDIPRLEIKKWLLTLKNKGPRSTCATHPAPVVQAPTAGGAGGFAMHLLGESDVRACYCAAVITHLLQLDDPATFIVADSCGSGGNGGGGASSSPPADFFSRCCVDGAHYARSGYDPGEVHRLIYHARVLDASTLDYLLRCQTCEGGLACDPSSAAAATTASAATDGRHPAGFSTEAHAAYTQCGLAAICIHVLSLHRHLQAPATPETERAALTQGLRQMLQPLAGGGPSAEAERAVPPPSFSVERCRRWLARRQCGVSGGLSGRTNKLVDSCYSHWAGNAHVLLEALATVARHLDLFFPASPGEAAPPPPPPVLLAREAMLLDKCQMLCCLDDLYVRAGGAAPGPAAGDSFLAAWDAREVAEMCAQDRTEQFLSAADGVARACERRRERREAMCRRLITDEERRRTDEAAAAASGRAPSSAAHRVARRVCGRHGLCATPEAVEAAAAARVEGLLALQETYDTPLHHSRADAYNRAVLEGAGGDAQTPAPPPPLVPLAADRGVNQCGLAQLQLQRYVLQHCQHTFHGGCCDKPGVAHDTYHTCYALSGAAAAQDAGASAERLAGLIRRARAAREKQTQTQMAAAAVSAADDDGTILYVEHAIHKKYIQPVPLADAHKPGGPNSVGVVIPLTGAAADASILRSTNPIFNISPAAVDRCCCRNSGNVSGN